MLNEKYIANRIEELCGKRHMSRYALARIAGISESSISNIMSRGSLPSFLHWIEYVVVSVLLWRNFFRRMIKGLI